MLLLQLESARPDLSIHLPSLSLSPPLSKPTNFSIKSTEAVGANVIARTGNGHHEKLANEILIVLTISLLLNWPHLVLLSAAMQFANLTHFHIKELFKI